MPDERKRLTIGLFNDSFPPIMDGVSVMVRNYAASMDEDGVQPVVVTPRVPGRREEPFRVVEYRSLGVPGGTPYRIGLPKLDRRLIPTLRAIPFDLVHAHCHFSSGKLALSIARSRGIPIIATMHSRYREDIRKLVRLDCFTDFFVKKLVDFYESVDEVWVPNASAGEVLRSYGYSGEIAIQENGTELDPPDETKKAELRRAGRESVGVRMNQTVALYVGQQRREKNVGMIIRALDQVTRQGRTDVSAIFVGEGPDLSAFRELARDLGLGERAVFTGLVNDRDRMRELYAAADFFVFPSTYDTDGIVVTEASAFALPSIAARGSGPGSRIADGENGLLCDVSVESLANQVERLALDAALRRRLGAQARRTLYRSAEEVAASVYRRYASIVEGG